MEKIEENKKFFSKISSNLFSYILSFTRFSELTSYILVSKTFGKNVTIFLKNLIKNDKKAFDFYQKNIFLLNRNFGSLYHKNIYPYVNSLDLFQLFENNSIKIKQFLYELEEEQLTNNEFVQNLDLIKFRKLVLQYITNHVLISMDNVYHVSKIYLVKSNIGNEGSLILSHLIQRSKYLEFLDLSNSQIDGDDLAVILNQVYMKEGYFQLNLIDTKLTGGTLKTIKYILSKDPKKHITIGETTKTFSKASADNSKRTGKHGKKSKKEYFYNL